ncbi:MAG: alpha-ribazole phosphatase [Peptococcaceae bacterium]|nr:alpha-ribazole phosphatase [Peptococcaceae bacterium]
MSCRLYLIRHGETEWNKAMKFQGQTDIPLIEDGMRQAAALGRRMSSLKLEALYSSDLTRAYETAQIVASYHNKQVEIVPELKELNFGDWEGLTHSEIKKKYPDELKLWWNNPFSINVPGGESFSELSERAVNAIKRIIEKHRDGQVAVVSHGGVIRCIIGHTIGIAPAKYWRLRLHNASVSILDFPHNENDGILTLFNDCSHIVDDVAGLC